MPAVLAATLTKPKPTLELLPSSSGVGGVLENSMDYVLGIAGLLAVTRTIDPLLTVEAAISGSARYDRSFREALFRSSSEACEAYKEAA